jgi:HAMP domain-containing protein
MKNTSSDKIRFGLRSKLFFLVLFAFSLMILATLWQIGAQAKRVSTKSIEHTLNHSRVILNSKMSSRFDSIEELARGIARDGRVQPLVYEGESLTLQDLSLEFQRALEFDILFFTDSGGTILARSDRPEAVGANLAGRSVLFDDALAGKSSQGIFVSQGKLLQIVVVPVHDNIASDIVRGSLALAYELSQDIALEIHDLTLGEVSFFIFSRDGDRNIDGVDSTFSTDQELGENLQEYLQSNPSVWQDITEAQTSFAEIKFQLDDEQYYAAVQILSNADSRPLGFSLVMRSETELMRPFVEIQKSVAIIGLLCLLGASVFAWLFAIGVSRPILSMVRLTENIKDGVYPEKGQEIKRSDEVGHLQRSIVAMGNSLKEKSELENYLALISDEIISDDSVSNSGALSALDLGDDEKTLTHHPSGEGDATVLLDSLSDRDSVITETEIVVDQRYRLMQLLGSGSVGDVYLALDLELDERVAIKLMSQSIFDRQTSVDFKEEIRLARKITHRNILRIFDFGTWQDKYYITMEYVSGYDLGKLLRSKGALDVSIGIVMARQICTAMYAAHEQGIIHRDLKPANMMINRQGVLKIMDFGLATKVADKDDTQPGAANVGQGTVVGTPRYMAPEQFLNWNLDERSDIYSIGIILYALFSGEPPFSDKNYEKLAQLHLHADVPNIDSLEGDSGNQLNAIIVKALAKKPDDRYQNVRELLDELTGI